MDADEQQIRALIAEWMKATREGNTERVLELMTDDVVFLVPGRPPMRKSEFAAAAKAQSGAGAPRFDGSSEPVEVKVLGEWAFMWTKLSVTATAPDGTRSQRDGHTLSVLRKQDGRWRLARDANLLGPPRPA